MREPSYLKLYREGMLQDRIDKAVELMKSCSVCPRECRVDRLSGELGFCRTGAKAKVASLHAHFGEEAPLVGDSGSGTIFFRSCNLLCTFCQNFDISHDAEGGEVEPKDLAVMMLSLQRRGCHNINFVTPSHVVPQILQALAIAVENGKALYGGGAVEMEIWKIVNLLLPILLILVGVQIIIKYFKKKTDDIDNP